MEHKEKLEVKISINSTEVKTWKYCMPKQLHFKENLKQIVRKLKLEI